MHSQGRRHSHTHKSTCRGWRLCLQDAFLMQAALLGSIFAAYTVPPLILLVKGREHYVQWRHVYLPALLAVDCVALFKMSCWGLMPEVRSGDTAKLAFMVRQRAGVA